MVRRAVAKEATALADLWLASRSSAPGTPPPIHSEQEVRDWVCDVLLATREVWVVDEQETLKALMALHGEWVEQLYVAPGQQRRGYGSQLLAIAKESRSELALWTFEANAQARGFYESHGFLASGPVSSENEEQAPAVCYRWARRD